MKIRAWLAIVGSLAIAAAASTAVMAQDNPLPDGPGKKVLLDACSSCHDSAVVAGQKHTADEWNDVVNRMVGMGATVSDDQAKTITAYLTANFGPGDASAAAAPPAAAPTAPTAPPAQ
ncbi:MAG TPA: cytochrome c [Caulobacteraceae bacterium]|nr:cytochrome c [Caulobacteraceae bacterium]